jgi:hypothetical protein
MRGPRPLIPFRVLEFALVILVLFPFSIFVIRSQRQLLSRRIGDGRSTAVMPTDAGDARARLKELRARPRPRPASVIVMSLLVPLFWIGVFGVAGRRLFALRI